MSIVDDDQWHKDRAALLEQEKALAREYERVAKLRQQMSMHRVPDYELKDLDGNTVALSALFGDHSEMIVQHIMFDVDWEKACAFCCMWADAFSGALPHVEQRARLIFVAKASPEKLSALVRAKGWTVPTFSCAGSSFARDLHFEATDDEVSAKAPVYWGRPAYATQNQGLSVFKEADDGSVLHTYSTQARGLEFLSPVLTLLDITPSGRYDAAAFHNWAKHKEDYEAASSAAHADKKQKLPADAAAQ